MYELLMSRSSPGCVIFLLDRSESMNEPFAGVEGTTKKQKSAEAVNRAIFELVLRSRKGREIVPRCDVGIIGYGAEGPNSAFGSRLLKGRELVSITELAAAPLREPIGAEIPEWITPEAQGGTPMAEAFQLARSWAIRWALTRRGSFPPIVINVTDGEAYDVAAAFGEALAVQQVMTEDGSALVMNVHVSTHPAPQVVLPDKEDPSWDDFGKLLFQMSSVLPAPLIASAKFFGFNPARDARGYVCNANADTLLTTLRFGTTPTRTPAVASVIAHATGAHATAKWGGR